MSQDIVPYDEDVWGLIHRFLGGDVQVVPYIQEIFLLKCHVAGTSYLDLDAVEPELNTGDPLLFRREPENQYDALAIAIYDQAERKLGYLPRAKNEVPARLMDAGKLLFGKIEAKEWVEDWLKLTMRVYMRDM